MDGYRWLKLSLSNQIWSLDMHSMGSTASGNHILATWGGGTTSFYPRQQYPHFPTPRPPVFFLQVYLSPEVLLGYDPSEPKGNSSGTGGPTIQAATAPLLPLLMSHPEVVVLIDRGGAGGEQTFAEAAATAAGVVAAMPLPAPQGFFGGGGGGGCRCVGVIVANDQPDHEVFPMAAPSTNNNGEMTGRAPFPVVMISRESGQLLKSTLLESMGGEGEESRLSAGLCGGHSGGGHGGVMVSLGAAEHCPSPAAHAGETSAFACGGGSRVSPTTTSVSTKVSFEEEEDSDDGGVEEPRLATTIAAAGDGYWNGVGVVEYPFSHICGNNQQRPGGIGQPPSCYYSHDWRWSSAVPLALGEPTPWYAGNGVEEETCVGGYWRNEGVCEDTTGEWKRERDLYRAKTLPVRFNRPIW